MKNKKKIFIYIFLSFFVIFNVFTILLNTSINYKLKGDKEIELIVYEEYKENGYIATFLGKDISNYVKITSNLNNKKLGNYTITYNLSFLSINIKKERKIAVVDKIIPEIKLNGNNPLYIYIGDEFIDPGVQVHDNYDGEISSKVIINNNINNENVGTYNVHYSVTDSSGNTNSITREVILKEKQNNIIHNNNNKNNISNPMVNYIKSNNFDISFGYYNLITGKNYFYNENKVYFAASLIKTVEALYLYEHNMVNDETLPYIKKSISVSDNPSHHHLQKLIGKNNLIAYGKSLGAKYTLSGGGVCGNTTVNDQLIFLKKLYDITNNTNDELKNFFINDYGNYLKFDDKIPVMHKYGYYYNVYHDVGIILEEEPYIIIILTGLTKNYEEVINNLSKITYEYHLNQKSGN